MLLLAAVCAASVFAASRLNLLEPVTRAVLGAARDAEETWNTYSWAQAAPEAAAAGPSVSSPTATSALAPSVTPIATSTPLPTEEPAFAPTGTPIPAPTPLPTKVPTLAPTGTPIATPTPLPTEEPAFAPTGTPIPAPTPSAAPILAITPSPTPSRIVRHISAKSANVRSGPSTDYDKIETLKKGDTVVVLGSGVNGWSRIETPSGAVGYISEKLLSD
jgi:uncharacterized protein YgiM (DUF1202 family)